MGGGGGAGAGRPPRENLGPPPRESTAKPPRRKHGGGRDRRGETDRGWGPPRKARRFEVPPVMLYKARAKMDHPWSQGRGPRPRMGRTAPVQPARRQAGRQAGGRGAEWSDLGMTDQGTQRGAEREAWTRLSAGSGVRDRGAPRGPGVGRGREDRGRRKSWPRSPRAKVGGPGGWVVPGRLKLLRGFRAARGEPPRSGML